MKYILKPSCERHWATRFFLTDSPKNVVQPFHTSSDLRRLGWRSDYDWTTCWPRGQLELRNVRGCFDRWGGQFLGCAFCPPSGGKSPLPPSASPAPIARYYTCEYIATGIRPRYLTVSFVVRVRLPPSETHVHNSTSPPYLTSLASTTQR